MGDDALRVAVTGASGYVGSSLVRRLEREEDVASVLAVDVRPPRARFGPKVSFRQRDVTEPLGGLFERHGIDSVVHLAFLMRPRGGPARRVNVGGAANVLDACDAAGVGRLLYLSSTTVYGARPDNPPELTEESPVRPVRGFRYGEHKAEAEAAVGRFAALHPVTAVTVLRACPVMGPNADNFISRAFSKPLLVAVRDHDPEMQMLHEDDLTEAMTACLLRRTSGTYNLAGAGALRWSRLAGLFGRRLVTLPAPVLYGMTGLAWTLRLQSDSPPCGLDFIRYRWTATAEKARRELGIEPRHSTEEAWTAFVERARRVTPDG